MKKRKYIWVVNGRTDIFWQNLLNGLSPDWSWKKNFRMNRDMFFELNNLLLPYLAPNPNSPNYKSLESDKKLALTLYFLKALYG